MKTALVCGAGGFIGSHLVHKLKCEGYLVRGVDLKRPEFSDTGADEFLLLDLRDAQNCERALSFDGKAPDEVYNLAADMGGMGFIHSAECEIMRNSALDQHQYDPRHRQGRSRPVLLLLVGLHLP